MKLDVVVVGDALETDDSLGELPQRLLDLIEVTVDKVGINPLVQAASLELEHVDLPLGSGGEDVLVQVSAVLQLHLRDVLLLIQIHSTILKIISQIFEELYI